MLQQCTGFCQKWLIVPPIRRQTSARKKQHRKKQEITHTHDYSTLVLVFNTPSKKAAKEKVATAVALCCLFSSLEIFVTYQGGGGDKGKLDLLIYGVYIFKITPIALHRVWTARFKSVLACGSVTRLTTPGFLTLFCFPIKPYCCERRPKQAKAMILQTTTAYGCITFVAHRLARYTHEETQNARTHPHYTHL